MSSATASPPLQRRAQATRQRLVDATVACLIERGYAGTSIPEICKRAGASRGAQLHHFPTKAHLVAAAVDQLFRQRLTEFAQRLPPVPPADRLGAAFNVLWDIYTGPTFFAWAELVVAARTDPELAQHITAVDRQFTRAAEEACATYLCPRGPQQVRTLTRLILSFFDGLALHTIVESDAGHLQNVRDLLRERINALFAQSGATP